MTLPSRLLTMSQFSMLTDLKAQGPRYVDTCKQNTLKAMVARGFVEVRPLDAQGKRPCAWITDAGRAELDRG